MGKVTKYPHGTFSWLDAVSTDAAKDKAFYQAALEWEVNDVPMGDGEFYTMFHKSGDDVAGLGQMQKELQDAGVPSHWNSYVAVDDVDALTAKVEGLGGKVVAPPFDVFDSGRMSVITDPAGATIAFWQAKSHIGATRVNEHGALVWNELATRNPEAAIKFYGDLMGWTFSKMEEMDYWLIHNNGRMNGGIMRLSDQFGEDAPSYWMNYLHVDDITAAVEKVKSSGGSIAYGPAETGAGTFATITSPSGAHISLIQTEGLEEWVE